MGGLGWAICGGEGYVGAGGAVVDDASGFEGDIFLRGAGDEGVEDGLPGGDEPEDVLGEGGVRELGDEVGEGRDEDVEDGNPEFAAVEDGHGVSSP